MWERTSRALREWDNMLWDTVSEAGYDWDHAVSNDDVSACLEADNAETINSSKSFLRRH